MHGDVCCTCAQLHLTPSRPPARETQREFKICERVKRRERNRQQAVRPAGLSLCRPSPVVNNAPIATGCQILQVSGVFTYDPPNALKSAPFCWLKTRKLSLCVALLFSLKVSSPPPVPEPSAEALDFPSCVCGGQNLSSPPKLPPDFSLCQLP